MNYISDLLFWISNGLLVPVIVGLLILFLLSLLLLGTLFGSYRRERTASHRYTRLQEQLRQGQIEEAQAQLQSQGRKTPFEEVADALLRSPFNERILLIDRYQLLCERRLGTAHILTKFGPILGLMGTLIPMGPALVGLSTGDIADMAYNMQVAFATTVVGMFASAVGYLYTHILARFHKQDLIRLDFIHNTLSDEQE